MSRIRFGDASEGRTPLESGLIGLVAVAVVLGGVSIFWDPIAATGSGMITRGRQALGLSPSPDIIVRVSPGQDRNFVWHDAIYADGHMRRTRFERRDNPSAGLSARRKIFTDYDAFCRVVQEQDGTQDGRNLNLYRFVYALPGKEAVASERHDLYVFYDGSADTADQYAGASEPGLIKGRPAIAGTYSAVLAAFLAVPDVPAVDRSPDPGADAPVASVASRGAGATDRPGDAPRP